MGYQNVECDIAILLLFHSPGGATHIVYLPLLLQRLLWRASLGTIFVKFCTEVKIWLSY